MKANILPKYGLTLIIAYLFSGCADINTNRKPLTAPLDSYKTNSYSSAASYNEGDLNYGANQKCAHGLEDELGSFTICYNTEDQTKIIISSATTYRDGVCVFPINQKSASEVFAKTGTNGDPLSLCADINSIGSELIFDTSEFNAVLIVEANDRTLTEVCLTGKQTFCPISYYLKFR